MGNLGVVIGWPLLMGMIIITSNAAGVVTGEWDGVSAPSKLFLPLAWQSFWPHWQSLPSRSAPPEAIVLPATLLRRSGYKPLPLAGGAPW